MKNRSLTPARSENDFINAGTAGIDGFSQNESRNFYKAKTNKAKPISISLAEEHLNTIDRFIKEEAIAGNARVNRSDIVRAGILGLEKLSQLQLTELIEKVKLK